MQKISKGIVFSEDINVILNGVNAFDYKYEFIPRYGIIKDIRENFKNNVNKIFNGNTVIISEEEMSKVNKFIGGEYPHCYIR